MHSTLPKREFALDIGSHHLVLTYQPEHMHIKTIHKHTHRVTQGYFLEETLPQEVKEQCEKVKDLYEFLSTQKQTDIQVNKNDFRFKIVRIKKERWYNLNLTPALPQSSLVQGNSATSPNLFKQHNFISAGTEKHQLQLQNRKLREKIKGLKKSYRTLKQLLENRQNEIKKLRSSDCDVQTQTSSHMMLKNRLSSLNLKPSKLEINFGCPGIALYSVKNNFVEKISNEATPLIFKNTIKRQARVSFSVSIQSELHNSWMIFGLMTAQLFNSQFCYCIKNTIAFDNNLGVVFVQMETLKCEGRLGLGDTLQLGVCDEGMVWTINKKPVCMHMMPEQLKTKPLFPFLILSQPGDSVRLNCEQKLQR